MKATVSTRFDDLAAQLAQRYKELADEYVRRASAEMPEWTVERPDLADAVRVGARQSMGTELRALAAGCRLPASCPDVDADGARYAARLGVPLHHVLLQYRLGHAIQWEAWFELVDDAEPDPNARRDLLERASRFFFAYADRMSRFATELYTDERERLLQSREQRRVQLVRELLEGGEVDADAIGYDVDGMAHLGVVAWGRGGDEAVAELARALDRTPLVVSAADETWWAWLGAHRAEGAGGPAAGRAERALRRLRTPPGARLALGTPADGRDGFRRTHRQAAAAHRAAVHSDTPLVRYEDVALETLAASDATAAREFVELELGGIDGDDVRSTRLRETLVAWFGCGQNAAATAARLGVHEQTVAQRLRAVEERTGRPVVARRAELETALRLRRLLSPSAAD